MSDLRCPRCGESFRIPSVDLPSGPPAADLGARCPWCAELIPLTQLLTALPPVAQLIGHDGQPLELSASGGEGENPFALQSAGLPAAAAAADTDALTAGAQPGEEAFGGAEDFAGDSFDFAAADVAERDAEGLGYLGDDRDVGDGPDGDANEHYGDSAGSDTDFDASGFDAEEPADPFELGEHAGPVDPRPIEEVSGVSFAPDGHLVTSRARAKKKSSSLRSILGVVVGGLLALPLAAGILALIGKPLDLGFWPFDGKTIATGGSARTAAPMLPLSDEPRPARPPQQGRSLAEDMPRGQLMTMDPAEEPGVPGAEQPAANQSENPWEFSQSPGRTSPVGPEMVTPQLAEEVEPDAAADAAALDPFAAEPFAADARSGDGAAPEVADPQVAAPAVANPSGAEPDAAAPDDFAASMNRDPFAALDEPVAPLEPEPTAADPAAAAANAFSLDDPLLTLPADRADAAAQPRDEAEMSQQDAAAPEATALEATALEAAALEAAAATDAAAERGESVSPASEPATESPSAEMPAAEATTPGAAPAETVEPPAPVTEVTAQPAAGEASPVAPAEPAGDAPAMVAPEPPSREPLPEASSGAEPTEAAAVQRPASSPEFAAAKTAAESALQAIRDYDLAAGVAGLRPHLAKLYEHVAALGELATPQDAAALAALTEQLLEINVLKDLAPAAPNWAKYSRRPNDGMLAVGPLRQEADTWFLDWGGPTPLEIRFSQGDANVQPQAKVLVLGRILSSEPSAPAIEATFLQSLD